MPHVVTDTCINCKHTYCAEVCPADAFHEGPNFLVIDPEQCIDCMLCVHACVTHSIMEERDIPADQQSLIALNAKLASLWPSITTHKPAPPDTEEWEGVPYKLTLLDLGM